MIKLKNLKWFEKHGTGDKKELSVRENFKRRASINLSLNTNEVPEELKEIKAIELISWGHLQILETIMTGGHSTTDTLLMIGQYLLRPKDEALLDNENEEKENAHKEFVYDLPIGIIHYQFERYMKMREHFFYTKFNGIIYKARVDNDDSNDDSEEEEEEVERGMTNEELYSKRFFWHSLTMIVAEHARYYQQILDSTVGFVIEFIAEKRLKEIIREEKMNKNRKK